LIGTSYTDMQAMFHTQVGHTSKCNILWSCQVLVAWYMQWQQAVTVMDGRACYPKVSLKLYKTTNYTRLVRWQTELTHWNNKLA